VLKVFQTVKSFLKIKLLFDDLYIKHQKVINHPYENILDVFLNSLLALHLTDCIEYKHKLRLFCFYDQRNSLCLIFVISCGCFNIDDSEIKPALSMVKFG